MAPSCEFGQSFVGDRLGNWLGKINSIPAFTHDVLIIFTTSLMGLVLPLATPLKLSGRRQDKFFPARQGCPTLTMTHMFPVGHEARLLPVYL